jgi:hypothetical protein
MIIRGRGNKRLLDLYHSCGHAKKFEASSAAERASHSSRPADEVLTFFAISDDATTHGSAANLRVVPSAAN